MRLAAILLYLSMMTNAWYIVLAAAFGHHASFPENVQQSTPVAGVITLAANESR